MKAKSAILGLALSGIVSLPASGAVAVLLQYSSDHAPEDESLPVAPAYAPYDTYKGSTLAPAAGSGVERHPESLTFGDWGSKIDLNKYVGFTVSAEPGYELHVTHLEFETGGGGNILGRSSVRHVNLYMWGYRVDQDGADGPAGYDGWVFSQMFNPADPDYNSLTSWEINDLYTTGTVEFGLFARSDYPQGEISLESVTIKGTTPIPEPSSFLLMALSVLGLWRRTRFENRPAAQPPRSDP